MKIFFILSCLILVLSARGARVDTVTIYSKAMNKSKKCIVITPYSAGQKPIPLPVVYLLHGHSGDYSNWLIRVPQLMQHADQYNLIIVCPDGDYDSWYFDSPVDSTMKYDTYISTEVPAFIDENYLTIRNRKARAITGLSMGGHGGLYLGFRHADFFGACGSMSGAVDLNVLRTRFDIMKRIGDTVRYAANWLRHSVKHVIEKYPADSIAVIIDCGTNDFFYPINKQLHEKMLALKIPHEYIERPGSHNWSYWANAVQYQLLFFRNYFDSGKIYH